MLVRPASDASVIVMLGDAISRETHANVVHLFRRFRHLGDDRIRNLHPAYASILVEFDPLRMTHGEASDLIARLLDDPHEENHAEFNEVQIPVCYDLECGPDLESVAQHAGMTLEQVIAAHTSAEYFVCFLGFSPGFAYLGGLPSQLAMPRLSTPRKLVPAGSVGIAGVQTGVYPVNSPGGWQLIGRTPLRMFDPSSSMPTRLQIGDTVRFVSISRERFDALQSAGAELP